MTNSQYRGIISCFLKQVLKEFSDGCYRKQYRSDASDSHRRRAWGGDSGIDLTHPLPEDTVQYIRQALLAHCVLLFRGQRISDEDQVRFTNYFGQAVEHVRKQLPRPVKEIFFVSNVEKDGQPIGALGKDEIPFHSDLSYLRQPGTLSIIYASSFLPPAVPRGGATVTPPMRDLTPTLKAAQGVARCPSSPCRKPESTGVD